MWYNRNQIAFCTMTIWILNVVDVAVNFLKCYLNSIFRPISVSQNGIGFSSHCLPIHLKQQCKFFFILLIIPSPRIIRHGFASCRALILYILFFSTDCDINNEKKEKNFNFYDLITLCMQIILLHTIKGVSHKTHQRFKIPKIHISIDFKCHSCWL